MNDSTHGASLMHLSAKARHVLSIDPGRAYRKLVVDRPGAIEARDLLESMKPAEVVDGRMRDASAAACVAAGLWLWHDFLDDAHTLCQEIKTPSGAMWHAIVHRREGDFGNAKYWYRQCAGHAVVQSVAARVMAVTHDLPSDKAFFRLTANGWAPEAFVDLVEALHQADEPSQREAAVLIQRIEWQALFEHDLRTAAT